MTINRTNLTFFSPGQDVAPTQLPPSSGFDGGASLCGSDAAAAYAFPSDAAAEAPSSSAAPEEFQANNSCMPLSAS